MINKVVGCMQRPVLILLLRKKECTLSVPIHTLLSLKFCNAYFKVYKFVSVFRDTVHF